MKCIEKREENMHADISVIKGLLESIVHKKITD